MHDITWMSLEDTVLSEMGQTQKDQHCLSHLAGVPRIVKFIDTESAVMVARGWGLFNRYGVSLMQKESIPEVGCLLM